MSEDINPLLTRFGFHCRPLLMCFFQNNVHCIEIQWIFVDSNLSIHDTRGIWTRWAATCCGSSRQNTRGAPPPAHRHAANSAYCGFSVSEAEEPHRILGEGAAALGGFELPRLDQRHPRVDIHER